MSDSSDECNSFSKFHTHLKLRKRHHMNGFNIYFLKKILYFCVDAFRGFNRERSYTTSIALRDLVRDESMIRMRNTWSTDKIHHLTPSQKAIV